MKFLKNFLPAILALATACSGSHMEQSYSKSANAANSAANTAAPSSAIRDENDADLRMKTATDKGSGKGGGGGGQEEKEIRRDNIPINQADKSQPAPIERKIIRNAELSLETSSPEEAQQKISGIIQSKGGFILESTQTGSDAATNARTTITMSVRVPSEKFGESIDEIRKTATRVIIETIKSDDVTEEFIDVEARLKTQKALEMQFLEIMKRANSVEEALDVQSKLADVRGEIEKVEGRKRFLENQTSLSTIKIILQTPNSFSPNSSGFFYKLSEAVSNGFDSAIGFLLFLVQAAIALLPFFLLIALPIYLLIRYFWRKRKPAESRLSIIEDEIKE